MHAYPCWHCGAPNDRHREYEGEDATPAPGDASLCCLCGHIGVFTVDGTRRPTLAEAAVIAREPVALEAVRRWLAGEDLRR